MPDVLIRDVPDDDLDLIRSAASARGESLQSYLRSAVHGQASYLRRQEVLQRVQQRLHDRPLVPEAERTAVLDAMDAEHHQRAEQLGDRNTP